MKVVVMNAWKCRAAFILTAGGAWTWITFTHEGRDVGNKHAAIIGKAKELGAVGWDFSQAEYAPADRFR